MRRRALQIANLKHAATVSAQTDKSYFRRENDTQVYLPKNAQQQTGIERGTNPPRVHRYITGELLPGVLFGLCGLVFTPCGLCVWPGLRGGTEVVRPEVSADGTVRIDAAAAREKTKTKASVVTLTYDL